MEIGCSSTVMSVWLMSNCDSAKFRNIKYKWCPQLNKISDSISFQNVLLSHFIFFQKLVAWFPWQADKVVLYQLFINFPKTRSSANANIGGYTPLTIRLKISKFQFEMLIKFLGSCFSNELLSEVTIFSSLSAIWILRPWFSQM